MNNGSSNRPIFFLALVCMASLLIAPGCFSFRDGSLRDEGCVRPELTQKERELNAESFDIVWNTINDNWYDPGFNGIDWEQAKIDYSTKLDSARTMPQARYVMSSLLDLLGVTHMAIIPSYYYEVVEGKPDPGFAVTGIDLRVLDGRAIVTSVTESSPADSAGVKPGWEVIRIDSVMAADQIERFTGYARLAFREDMILSWAVKELMMGRPGAVVQVEFEDGTGSSQTIEIALAEEAGKSFQFGHVPEFKVRFETDLISEDIGYIRFNCFADPPYLMGNFNETLASMLDMKGIVIDLRGNPGGVGALAIGMAGWFTREKGLSLGRFITRETSLEMLVNPRHNAFQGPVAILVDGLSGSAAEFLSGGMQGLELARVFGTRTVGAALPSNFVLLPNGDRLQFVTANFLGPDGEQIEGRGVIPDVEISLKRETLLAGRDDVVEGAVDWIRSREDRGK